MDFAPVLPEAVWACEMAVDAAARLAAAGLEVAPLVWTSMVREEAREMWNCLASSVHYINDMMAGRSRIFSIRGEVRATLQMVFDGTWRVAQQFGPGNLPLSTNFLESDAVWWGAIRGFVNEFEAMAGG